MNTLARTAAWPIDGYLISCPFYSRAQSNADLNSTSARLADRAEHPVLLYNIPYRTGVNLGNEAMLRLAAHPNIIGVKDCCDDRSQSIDLLRRRPDDFAVLTGEDTQYMDALSDGADGGVLASAHMETDTFAEIHRLAAAGQRDAALARWRSVADLTRLLFAEPNPAPIKYWLVAHRTDRERGAKVADDRSERRVGGTPRSGDRASSPPGRPGVNAR